MKVENLIKLIMQNSFCSYETAKLRAEVINESIRRKKIEGKKTGKGSMQDVCYRYITEAFPDVKFIANYPIAKVNPNGKKSYYWIDIYCPQYNLAIEVDEYEHLYYESNDANREEYIMNEIGCEFIRFDPYGSCFIINDITEKIKEFFQLTPPKM